jgi:nicotinamide mononucleotide transporter
MSLNDWGNLLWHQMKDTDGLQWLAVIFGVAEVLLARSNRIWSPFPFTGKLDKVVIELK